MESLGLLVALLGFVAFFTAFWTAICVALGFLGGWHELARAYRAREPFRGVSWPFQSGRMWGLTRYNHILTVGASAEGLSLRVFGPFRPGHPPLFIPWSDLSSVEPKRRLFRDEIELRFRGARTPVQLSAALEERLRGAAGTSWPALARSA